MLRMAHLALTLQAPTLVISFSKDRWRNHSLSNWTKEKRLKGLELGDSRFLSRVDIFKIYSTNKSPSVVETKGIIKIGQSRRQAAIDAFMKESSDELPPVKRTVEFIKARRESRPTQDPLVGSGQSIAFPELITRFPCPICLTDTHVLGLKDSCLHEAIRDVSRRR